VLFGYVFARVLFIVPKLPFPYVPRLKHARTGFSGNLETNP